MRHVYILAHDLGTTGDKATLFDAEGNLVASAFAPYPVSYPRPGWAEQDPDDYWAALRSTTREILSSRDPGEIGAVSFSGQMQAALPVDQEGTALCPSLIWADQRSTAEAGEIAAEVPAEKVYAITGHRLSASYSAAKIMWIRKNLPDVYRRTWKFLHVKDFLVLRLTGEPCTDFSDASGMNLLDITGLRWSTEMLKAAGIHERLLPEPRESTAVAGTVTRRASAETGLLQGTPVVIGGGDGTCATCGAGVVSEGEAYVCLGTSAWLATASTRPFFDPQARICTFCHFRKGLYFPCGTMQSAGAALRWFIDTCAAPETARAEAEGVSAFDVVAREAEAEPAGSEGLIFLPYLMGERSPWWDPDARGCFIGLSMRHGRGAMARAVMEGVACNMRLVADVFEAMGASWRGIRMIGGGARGPAWRRIFADVLGMPVTSMRFMEEATSAGAAIAGGVGIGLFTGIEDAARLIHAAETIEPDPARAACYRRRMPAFTLAYERLAPVFRMLGEATGS